MRKEKKMGEPLPGSKGTKKGFKRGTKFQATGPALGKDGAVGRERK